MDKKVTVLTPNGRRQNVRVNPNTTLLQILEEACQKHGFNSDEYCLKHHNKEIGLTLTFRFSGLPNNCLLEMVLLDRRRVATSVDICVQLENGARNQGTFLPSDNLWFVIGKLFEEAATEYEHPVAIYMRQDFYGQNKLATTTLKSLGITEGRALIRFINKHPDELKTQANVYIAPVVKDTKKEDDVSSASRLPGKVKAPNAGGFAITKDLVQSLKKSTTDNDLELANKNTINNTEEIVATVQKPKYDWGTGTGRSMRSSDNINATNSDADDTAKEKEDEPEVTIIGERNAIIFSLDSMHKQIEDLPDSFYDLTVHDLKLVLNDLRKTAAGTENEPILTAKLRELEENKTMLNKIGQYKNSILRIQFPDRYVLQGTFKPVEKISDVMDFVRKFLIDPEIKFNLFTIPPKVVLAEDKTLLELDFVPNALVYFGLENEDTKEEQTFIKDEFLDKLTSGEGALYAASKLRILGRKSTTSTNITNDNNNETPITTYDQKSPGPSTTIPKRARNDNQST